MEMKISEDHGLETNEVFVRQFVTKQVSSSDVMATSNKLPDDDFIKAQLGPLILPPPYDPFQLSVMLESSSILSQCIDVMEVNVDSFGFELRPSVDEQAFAELRKDPKIDAEVQAEERRVKNFFKYCNRSMSYTQIRRRLRRDYETVGNGYFEVLRNHLTQMVTGLEWLPAHTMRIGRVDKMFTNCMAVVKTSDTTIELVPDKRKFRRYVQIKEQQSKPTWFKEFGDPRVMDAETGGRATVKRNENGEITEIVPEQERGEAGSFVFDVKKMQEGRMKLATEVIHFCNFKASRTLPYGCPRWVGNLINIVGARSAEEVNYLYFDNKTVPPGMMLVAGGRLTQNSVDRITNHIKENLKGVKNFHSILVVEAESRKDPNMPNSGVPQLQWVSMKDAQNTDALFQVYDQNAMDKVISSFRFWSGYVSRTKDINVATADVARQISEEQVFQPEREEFDSIINRLLIVELRVNYWEHKTKGPQLTSAKQMAEILDKVKPYLTGKEGRMICETIFGREFEDLESEWLKKPMALVIAELAKAATAIPPEQKEAMQEGDVKIPGGLPEEPAEKQAREQQDLENLGENEEKLTKFVKKLLAVRAAIEKAETDQAEALVGPR